MGKSESAVSALQQAIILRPESTGAYSSLGLAWARQKRYDLAIPALQKAIGIDGENQEAMFNLATAYSMIGQFEMAAQKYKSLLEIDQKDVEAMHNLGMIYLKHLKNMQQAGFYFKKALAADPDYDQAATVRDILSQIQVSNF
jgi:tetratricopeptide (TPR) repeat protein